MANLFLLGLIILVGAWIISFLTRDKEPKHEKDTQYLSHRKHEYKLDITVSCNGGPLQSQLKVSFPCSELTVRPFGVVTEMENPEQEMKKKEVICGVQFSQPEAQQKAWKSEDGLARG
jgi:hypothetical protein